MNYGVKRALASTRKGLRKAGQAIVDFDTAYAQKVQKGIDPQKDPIGEMTRGVPLKDLFAPSQAENAKELAADIGFTTAVGVANVASRYALPAGGVTLAGKALYDLTTGFGGGADQPEPATLPM